MIPTEAGPSYIDVNFSDNINPSTISPTDLVLSGTGLNAANPARATSLAWIDDHAIRFFLSGTYSNGGTVDVSIPQGSIKDTSGAAVVGFLDAFKVASTVATTPVTPVASTSPLAPTAAPVANVIPAVQPVAAAAPVAAMTTTVKLTAKQLKHQAAEAKAEKAAEAKAAKHAAQVKAAEAKAAAKAAHHKAKKAK